MGLTLTQKIVAEHLVVGRAEPGEEIVLHIDQTLLREMPPAIRDLQTMDCPPMDSGSTHQTPLERSAVPGQIVLGAGGCAAACGAFAMLAITAQDIDIAAALAGRPLRLFMPRTVLIRLTGRLRPCAGAKHLVPELPRPQQVRDGMGYVFEYGGPGVATLTVPERAAICGMAVDKGAKGAIFPSDAQTRAYLRAHGREDAWQPLTADLDAAYDETIPLDLGRLEPARSATS